MKVKTNPFGEFLSPLRQYFQKDSFSRKEVNEKPPLRSALFSVEQIESHAGTLAHSHQLSKQDTGEKLLKRLAENEEVLVRVTSLLQAAVREKTPVMPAGEWLLDNFYLIEEQIRTGKRYLPKGYSKGLPKLRSGPSAGFPRVYDIAIEIIAHSDGHVDLERLTRFVESYQKIRHLTLGELWAIPIMLRLALLENLRRVAARIGIDRIDADLAHHWADRIIETSEKDPKNLVLVIADMARSGPPMVSAFVAELTRKLQWKGPNLAFVLNWIEQHLSDAGLTINALVLEENQKQAADQVSMANSINSLRFLSKMDWREFVESMSIVEQTLRGDAEGSYAGMDFQTRDRYRHRIEEFARQSKRPENEVAKTAVALSREALEKEPANRRNAHVGYYLLGEGTMLLQKIAGVRLDVIQAVRKTLRRHAQGIYSLSAFVVTLGVGGALGLKAYHDGVPAYTLGVVSFLSLLGASHFAFSIVNWLATLWVKPSPLPKMDFSSGIPEPHRTLVVVPTILANLQQADKVIEDLEVHFLSNRDPHLHFALLTDLKDAAEQTQPDDQVLIHRVKKQIEELNQKYGRTKNDTFFLFHRPRQWNPHDKMWMGYERKRGKLIELNQLLRGEAADRFSVIVGESEVYSKVKNVITLDSDTQLPREAAAKLVGIMAHPLNHPVYDAGAKRIVKGYGVVQPRISISLHGATRSRYTRMHESDTGIDPYTRVTSDVYQDVFEEGSFIGKGIYDVDAFVKVLHNRFPDNRILSHDLLEGSYVRCGFASEIQLYEEYPSRYREDMMRRHRWIRGDWQIGNWVLPFAPDNKGVLKKNPITALSRWKIFDNLRRSLVPVCIVLLQILAWTVLPSAWFWTTCVIAFILLPPVIISVWNMGQKPKEVDVRQHVANSIHATYRNVLQAVFSLICLPYEAFISLDAILRTFWRVWISRRLLLEWNPSSFIARQRTTFAKAYGMMWIVPVISAALIGYLSATSIDMLVQASPFILLWISSPAIVWWFSLPLPANKTTLTAAQKITLRVLARKTWSFFENLIGAADHWLPPDNLQLYPIPVIAHRTSPTNMGMALLANLTAHDFGYITAEQLLQRTRYTLDSMAKLERYAGHFYNWYDTKTLTVLQPYYISTVDSGNLAAHLLTLRQGLLGMANEKIFDPKTWAGLSDTVRIMGAETDPAIRQRFLEIQKEFDAVFASPPTRLDDIKNALDRLNVQYRAWLATAPATSSTRQPDWSAALGQQLEAAVKDLSHLAPWLALAPAPDKFKKLPLFYEIPTVAGLTRVDQELRLELQTLHLAAESEEEKAWLSNLQGTIKEAGFRARERLVIVKDLSATCLDFADMSYDFLYDKSVHLLTVGYTVDAHHRDASFYDLLGSESRLSVFVAIAQGKVPQESWFALGRRLTPAGDTEVLLSWSGSMFEYLMPLLVMPTYENTLLDETYRGVVRRQIEYGKQHGVPWGISESCYNTVDVNLIYQYRGFGVPGLGFKRGLGQDLVVAPYASVLALMVDPAAAYLNLEKLASLGYQGQYGFYESIDYTIGRLPRGDSQVVIQTFMVHHQAMSLLALSYVLLEQPMQKRFEADPQFQTALLLLQEQVPKTTGFYSAASDKEEITHISPNAEIRINTSADTPLPEVQLLSNGRYHVMVTNAGGGYSRWNDTAVTRWREDGTSDNWGTFCYLRNLDSDEFWSAAFQPTCKVPTSYEVIFSQGRVEFRRQDSGIETHTEIIVSPEDDIEIRRVTITNHSKAPVRMEVTSYAEVVLALAAEESSHPAFSNLFVQTEIIPHQQAILCTRRPRSHQESPPWMLHLVKVNGADLAEISFETDRSKFIGRGNTVADPRVMANSEPLSGTQGSVLDPIVAIQSRVDLKPDETVMFDIVTGLADTRQASQRLLDKYQDLHLRNRAFELSWSHSQVVLRQINATEADAQFYTALAGSVIYPNPSLRANPEILAKNQKGQSGLWSYSISGDLPIVLLEISDSSNITLVMHLLQARAFWQLKGLITDLVILNEDYSSYRQLLQEQIQGLVMTGFTLNVANKQGGIFMRSADQITAEDKILLQTVARIVLSDSRGDLVDQVNRRPKLKTSIPYFQASEFLPSRDKVLPPENLQFNNGIGGFSEDGTEYIITTTGKKKTPLPWINVIANRNFGTIISESGSAYTWAENAHEFRLTPWENDPVTDSSGEAFYFRDEETGYCWSPMPLPRRGKSPYVTHHGRGYSTFEHSEDGISSETRVYVDLDEAIKFTVIKIQNRSGRPRRLSVTGYAEWVLASQRPKSAMHIVTGIDSTTGALVATNNYNSEFKGYTAFFDVDATSFSFTADRTEFLGRNGTPRNPDGLKRTRLSGKVGAGIDPCAALQVPFELAPNQDREIIFRLGASKDSVTAADLIRRFRGKGAAASALEKVQRFWQRELGTILVKTPDPAFNLLANGWLLYQVLSCRLWGRSGFYQSGGAFGFRDQLQDILSVLQVDPGLAKRQILLSASRQFPEGDVQHWWHPPAGRGVRTLCSDDYLWLPFVAARYITTTGDAEILNEVVPFIDGRKLIGQEESYYGLPAVSEQTAILYDHCKRAIVHALRFGGHGLPLMGSGDWNDGMNLVGIEGRGESVWLGFFLFDVLNRFSAMALLQNDNDFARECIAQAEELKKNLNKNAWDGNWYLRAFFDDGSPLGSSRNTECRIDSIAQSWSVLSGGGEPARSLSAMTEVDRHLVDRNHNLIKLLEPPFDTGAADPGYIKGYLPGVRENGGQYTHAAIWMIMAFARLGDQRRTWDLMNLINPVNHGKTEESIAQYKAEPYVMAADVYGVAPHAGRGGWTWYTGSAGWTYQLVLEFILGLKREGNILRIEPCIPDDWKSVSVSYRYIETLYRIEIVSGAPDHPAYVTLDGIEQSNGIVHLQNDQKDHDIRVSIPQLKSTALSSADDVGKILHT
jgi:cyclic beta-1,2-glucan synthetase